MRKEKDFLGEVLLPEDAIYGIHAFRAREHFPDTQSFSVEWYRALAVVKRACYITVREFYMLLKKEKMPRHSQFRIIDPAILEALIQTCLECEEGKYFEHFIVPAVSGGAGTSSNMNMNEIIANASLLKLGHLAGTYDIIHPIEHANLFQSTNDVVPTALHLAVMRLLNKLEEEINTTRSVTEELEKKYRHTLRIGYTQMQEAVPTTYGRLFSSYSDALSRDWWRISKCSERIKVVNLGGSAIGTSITVPRYFIMEVVRNLQKITGLPVTRSENLSDATSNLDSLTEIHGILKSHAVNLEKIACDLRLLSSDLVQSKEIEIPLKQLGSSIMPGKVNPVIPEFIISATQCIYANDVVIASLCARGCLELNAYLPIIGHKLIESLTLLMACNKTITENLLTGLKVHAETAKQKLFASASITTALVPYIGYNKATEVASYMKSQHSDIFEANKKLKFIDDSKLYEIMKPEKLMQSGFDINDLDSI